MGALLSVTSAVKLNGPAVVGMPLMMPVELFSDSPAGSALATIDQVYGEIPPLACSVVVGYGTFTVPLGTVAVVMVKPVTIVPLYGWVAVCGVGALLSLTSTVKVNGPAVGGEPLMTPA